MLVQQSALCIGADFAPVASSTAFPLLTSILMCACCRPLLRAVMWNGCALLAYQWLWMLTSITVSCSCSSGKGCSRLSAL
jgi:hypothetical protein